MMSKDYQLLHEIEQEAEHAKFVIREEIENSVGEIKKISLSDYSVRCPIRPIDNPIEECILELMRRCKSIEADTAKRVERLFLELKFFQFDVIKAAIDKTKYEIEYIEYFYSPIVETDKIKSTATVLLLYQPWILVNNLLIRNQLKKSCETAFRREIETKQKQVINYAVLHINRTIDRLMGCVRDALTGVGEPV